MLFVSSSSRLLNVLVEKKRENEFYQERKQSSTPSREYTALSKQLCYIVNDSTSINSCCVCVTYSCC